MNELEKNEALYAIGFTHIGNWEFNANNDPVINYFFAQGTEAIQYSSPALYALVVNGGLKYIGKTMRILRDRLYGYQRPGNGQATNIKVNALIRTHLANGNQIKILGFSPLIPLCYGNFKINLPAGLEDNLIEQLEPQWNGPQADVE